MKKIAKNGMIRLVKGLNIDFESGRCMRGSDG